VTWHDPVPAAAAATTTPGREFLQAMAGGAIPPPPISQLPDFRPVSAWYRWATASSTCLIFSS
jgi:hypothetical protein